MTTNHPENGPVSLDRLHQISEILSKAAAQSDGGNLCYAMADAVKVIDGAIATFGAEPVGEVVLGEYDDCGRHPDARLVCIAADGQADWENFKDGTLLYAVTPAPLSIDERAAFNAWNNEDNLPIAGVGAKNAAWLAWQARAAMLHTGNSPVIPDGNDSTVGKALTITLPDTSSKAFWSGTGKNEVFHPETYKCWAKEAIERAGVISGIGVVVR